MSLKKTMRHITLYLLMILASSCAWSQNLPLSTIQKSLDPPANELKNVSLPDPLKLNVTWWEYFNSAREPLAEKKIQEFLKQVSAQTAMLDGELKQTSDTLLKKVEINLNAYAQLSTKDAPTPLAKPISLESYTLKQLLELVHAHRDFATQLMQSENEAINEERQLKVTSRNLDTLLAAYLEMSATDPLKIIKGLEIIAERSQLAYQEQRLKIKKQNNDFQRAYLAELDANKEIAKKRLLASKDELAFLDNELNKSENLVLEAQNNLAKEQFNDLNSIQKENEDKNIINFRAQKILKAEIILAISEVQLSTSLSEKDLLTLLLADMTTDNGLLKSEIIARKQTQQDFNNKLNAWLEQNEINRIRLNEINDFPPESRAKSLLRDRLVLNQENQLNLQKLQTNLFNHEFVLNLLSYTFASQESIWSNIKVKVAHYSSIAYQYIKDKLHTSLFKVGDTPVTALGFARLLLIIIAAWWLAYWLNRLLVRFGARGEGEQLPAYYLIGRLTYYSIILIGFLLGLSAVGIDFTNFALVAGALAIGLGFGLQSILSNFVSGLILLFERSIKVGDFIELSEKDSKEGKLRGEVKEINVRSTIIRNNDGVDIIIPNSEFMNTKMLNWTLNEPVRRMRYPFRVAFGTDKEFVRSCVLAAVESIPHTLKGMPGRAPSVWLVGFGEFAYEFELVVWLTPRAVKRPNSVHAAYYWAIDNALRENNIEIPIPQRELRFKENTSPLRMRADEPEVEAKIIADLLEP